MRNSIFLLLFLIALLPLPAQAQWQEDGVPVSVLGSMQKSEIISDGAGGSIIAWETYYDLNDILDWYVFAQRLDAEGFPLWPAGGVPVCPSAGGQSTPKLVPDGAGGAIVAWTDFRNDNTDIYSQRLSPEGTLLWDVDGIAVCTAANTYNWSNISVVESPGGIIISWFDDRGGDFDIYAQKVDLSGTPLWTPDGITVCGESGDQYYFLESVPDGEGGAIASWSDYRSGGWDLYAQRISQDGTLLWASGGLPICTVSGSQIISDAVPDGSGGMICVWQDSRNDYDDVYTQRIDANGLPVWTPGGVPVCIELGSQLYPKLACDGSGGAFYSWSDLREIYSIPWAPKKTEIYAQHVSAGGDPQWLTGGILLRACCDAFNNGETEIIYDCFGGAVVTWYTVILLPCAYTEEAADVSLVETMTIYAQRVASDGTIWWQEGGVPLCDYGGNYYPVDQKMLPDGTGGAIVAWANLGWPEGIYAQRINGLGNAPPTGADDPPIPFYAKSYPNPFNPSTVIVYSLPEPAHVGLRIYDASGKLVKTLLDERVGAGRHEEVWNGTDERGCVAASGVYFCRLSAGDRLDTVKIVLLR